MHCSGKKIHSFYSLKKWKDLTFYCWIEIAYLVMIFAFALTDVLFPWSHETLTEHKGFVCVSVCSMYYLLNTWEHGALKRGAMGAISLPLRCQGGNFHHLGQIRRGFLEPRKWHQVTNNKCNIQAELKPMNTLSKHREEAKKKAQCWWRGKLGQLAELRMCTGSSGGSLVLNGKLRNWALIHHQVMVKS
jgi:hypothetical protein